MLLVLGTGTRTFSKGQGGEHNFPFHKAIAQRAKKLAQMATQLPGREKRKILATGMNIIKKCWKIWPDTIALRQYLENIFGLDYPSGQ